MRTAALVCCTVAVLALPALAGDVATLELLGWSADGRYFGLGNFGIHDGSGFAYADRTIIDTRTGRVVYSVARQANEEGPSAAVSLRRIRARVATASAQALARYRLQGAAAGTVVFRGRHTLPTEIWGRPGTGEHVPFTHRGTRYVLQLTQERRGSPEQDPYEMRGRLTAILQLPAGTRVLHRETVWNERYNHRIHSIVVGPTGQTVAVILSAWSLGFEGPDVRYRGLAASLRTR